MFDVIRGCCCVNIQCCNDHLSGQLPDDMPIISLRIDDMVYRVEQEEKHYQLKGTSTHKPPRVFV